MADIGEGPAMSGDIQIKDDGLSKLEKQRQQLDKQIQEARDRRKMEIGRIFEKMGLSELSDEVFYGLCDELKAAGLSSPRLVELARRGAEIAPKKPGRKAQGD